MKINEQYDYMFSGGYADQLGPVASASWNRDPKRLVFTLARYKFVAKIFSGMEKVLEIGCGDAWASRIVAQHVKSLTAVDYDPRFIEAARLTMSAQWPIKLEQVDFSKNPLLGTFDGIFLLDVFEHIPRQEEDQFLRSVIANLNTEGALIIGVPSLHSQDFIPERSRDPGHVNCKSGADLRTCLLNYFKNVFLFSMNDEVVHTGSELLAHYFIALCCNPIKR